MDAYERLKQLVVDAEQDVMKGLGGNKAAKVRARKKMQEIKAAAQDVRQALLSDKPGEAGEGDDAEETDGKKSGGAGTGSTASSGGAGGAAGSGKGSTGGR